MKKIVKNIAGIGILIIVAFFYAHIAKVHNIYDKNVDASEYGNTGIVTNLGIQQEFVCTEEHLDGVRIKSTVIESADDVTLKYTLKNLSTGETVATGQTEGKNVKNSKFLELPFEKVENCKDTSFELSVYSNVPIGTATGVGFAYEKTKEDTALRVAGEEVENGTLIMKTVTHRFDFETFFVFLAFALYVIIFMGFLYKIFK